MTDTSIDRALDTPVAQDGRSLLIDLATVLTSAGEPAGAAQRALETVAAAFGARGGCLSRAEREPLGDLVLVPVAVVGPHSSLLGDMPPLSVAAATEASGVYRDGQPLFLGNVYESEGSAELNGAARWREQLSAQAKAVVPVEALGRSVGTLALEWSAPRAFGPQERELLGAAASLIGLYLMRADRSTGDRSVDSQPDGESLGFGITREGLVIAQRAGNSRGTTPVRITAQTSAASWVDVHAVAPDRVLVLIASARGSGASVGPELLDTLRHTARVIAGRSTSDGTASALGARLRELAPAGATIDGWIGIYSPGTGAVEHALVGTSHARLLLADGRQMSADGDPDDAADRSSTPSTTWLPLPGDVLHAWMPGRADVRIEWTAVS